MNKSWELTEAATRPRDAETPGGLLIVINGHLSVPGGVGEVVKNIARRLRASGAYRPIVASAAWNGTVEWGHFQDIETIVVQLRTPFDDQGKFAPGFLRTLISDLLALKKLLKATRIDVVNLHFPCLNVAVFIILKLLRAYRGKIVLSFHGVDVQKVLEMRGLARMTWRLVFRMVDAMTCCSDALKAKLCQFAPGDRVQVIHNGVDSTLFEGLRGSEHNSGVIVHIGKFEYKKAQDILISAFKVLLQKQADLRLLIIGAKGPALDETRNLVDSLSLHDAITILVDVPHERIPRYMSEAQLFVLPSRIEPFGIVILEAGAAGVPVIATNTGGIPEILTDGWNGRLVPVDDVQALADAIWELLNDPRKAHRLAEQLKADVQTKWSWKKTAEAYAVAFQGKPPLTGAGIDQDGA